MATRKDWQEQAQAFEESFWRDRLPCEPNTAGTVWLSGQILQMLGLNPQEIHGVILDVGPGPTGRLTAINEPAIGIEPLAEAYLQMPGATMGQYRKLYAKPVEDRIEELVGTVDVVFSLNCLDHVFDVRAALRNIFDYCKPGAWGLISIDVNKGEAVVDPTHPVSLTHQDFTKMLIDVGFQIDQITSGNCYPAIGPNPIRHNWGGGIAYHWRISKPT